MFSKLHSFSSIISFQGYLPYRVIKIIQRLNNGKELRIVLLLVIWYNYPYAFHHCKSSDVFNFLHKAYLFYIGQQLSSSTTAASEKELFSNGEEYWLVTPRAAEKNGIKYSHHEHTKSLNLFIMSN
jgi:hypothetical protein